IIERLRYPHPARQYGDVGNKGDIAHELIALGPGVASEYAQRSLIWGEAEDGVQRGGLACAVGADEPEDATLLDMQVDAIECNGCAKGLAQAVCFYASHGFSVPPWRVSRTSGGSARPPAVRSTTGRAAAW